MLRLRLLILLFICNVLSGYCQGEFRIKNDRRSARVNFELVNNAIIIPVELNGVQLSFLLDTGVNTSVVINIEEGDSLALRNAQRINLRGLGGKEFVEAYRSEKNRLKVGKVSTEDLTLFLIYDEDVNFSPRLGVPVHGILGYDFFKDLIVKINYNREFIRVYDPERSNKRWSRYSELPIRLYKNKPYITAGAEIGDKKVPVNLMVDSGLGDAIWLFGQNPDLKVPQRSFQDFLGLGLMGEVTGHRAKISALSLGDHELKELAAAFPDSISLEGLSIAQDRDGSLGGEILKRFHVVFDYPQKMMYLRKNRHFEDPFHYDMSGITLEHSGFVIVESYEKVLEKDDEHEEGIKIETAVRMQRKFELKPSFQVVNIRQGSPAERAGLQVGDVIESVNGRAAHKFDLDELHSLFSSEEGKRIRLRISRGIESRLVEFHLENML